jgi:hypothetical protein
MKQSRLFWLITALALQALPALAVRPFVTDDARIIDQGQFTSEMWWESAWANGSHQPSVHLLAGVSVTQWLELTVAGSMDITERLGQDISNPVVQVKTLLLAAQDEGRPGLALSLGYVPYWGRGEAQTAGQSAYALLLVTQRFNHDRTLLHLNAGVTPSWTEGAGQRVRPYAGLGIEQALWHFDWRGVAEVFTGDPFDPARSGFAAQAGLRWLKSDLWNFDLIFGAQPIVNDRLRRTGDWEFWAQIGVRITLDAFTGGRPGRATGADGLWK